MNWTPFLVTLVVIGLTVYDLIVVVYFGTERSISRFVRVTWMRAPVVCFGCGFLCGHFCGPMLPESEAEKNMLPIRFEQPADALKPDNAAPPPAPR